ncbi:MAG: flagellar type III secretion system pore protein FliP [Deltaproteobacteria bacterium]|nr:flagellar type III secretion system pore protein FliP [Deltaproteobacteria bacterium]MBW2069718.1 flagellar type III secretion system pore protein FliP [Deltaproteobacteria bacterium]
MRRLAEKCRNGGEASFFPRGAVRVFVVAALAATALIILLPKAAMAESLTLPSVNFSLEQATEPQRVSVLLEILFILTVLSLAPAILVLMTSFTRIVVVFSFLRQALGTQQMPPNQVLVGLALFLTFFLMTPAWQQVNSQALQPYLASELTQKEALDRAVKPLREFMLKQTRQQDLALFVKAAKLARPDNKENVPILVLIPAFVISELKTAFQIGFLLYIPFLIIDMVVASVLLSMGMMMLPPIMISLPFKILLFVLVDGWSLLVGSLLKSFV